MPWEKQYKENDVLDRAMEAFWIRGYQATSMSELVAVTGINRGSIYAAFTDKRGLFLRALQHYDRNHRSGYLDGLAKRFSPREAILAVFRAAANQADNAEGCAALQKGSPQEQMNGKPTGCLLVNTALELSPHDPEIAAIIRESLREVEGFFYDRVLAGQADGTISRRRNPNEAAQALLGLLMGLRVLCRARPEPQLLDGLVKQAEAQLN